jgi:anti-sigma regulatory factor (Ser/Thr protein kinase)
MILPVHDENNKVSLFSTEEARLLPNAADIKKIVKILTHIYRDPFIWVQELLSNAIDIHTETNQSLPVIFSVNRFSNYLEVCISDFGTGLTPEKAKFTYTLLSSDKENTNTQIGGYGMGSKSPFAYTKSFLVETVADNTFYTYLVSINEGFINLDMLIKEARVAPNQTHIKIAVDSSDESRLISAIERQAKYFENVDFQFGPVSHLNKTKIVKFKDFSVNSNINYLHFTVGQVPYYPDYNQVSFLNKYNNLNIGLKFDIGEIHPLPTREDIEYTSETIKLIEKKFNKALDFLSLELDKKEKTMVTSSFRDFVKMSKPDFITIKDVVINTDSIRKLRPTFEPIKTVYSGINYESELYNLFQFHRLNEEGNFLNANVRQALLGALCINSESNSPKKNSYLYTQGIRYIVRPINGVLLGNNLLDSSKRKRLQTQLINWFQAEYSNYNSFIVPKTFKTQAAIKKSKEVINCKVNGSNYDYTIQDLLDKKKVVVGRKNNQSKTSNYTYCRYFPKVFFITVSDTNFKTLMKLGFESDESFIKRMDIRTRNRSARSVKIHFNGDKNLLMKVNPYLCNKLNSWNEQVLSFSTMPLEPSPYSKVRQEITSKLRFYERNLPKWGNELELDLLLTHLNRKRKYEHSKTR